MKGFWPVIALSLVSRDEARENGTESALPESKYRSFEERIEKVILPKIDFNETLLLEVPGKIQHLSEVHADVF